MATFTRKFGDIREAALANVTAKITSKPASAAEHPILSRILASVFDTEKGPQEFAIS